MTSLRLGKDHPDLYALIWWLVILLFCFGLYIAWDLGFIKPVFSRDQSHITKAIALLTIAACLHSAWHIATYSRVLHDFQKSSIHFNQHENHLPIEIIADKLRAPVEAGWFMVDLAIRLGLAGTIIGFILIFSSLTGERIVGEDALQQLLVSMSVGMGTALFTTLAGLVAAIFLSMQYMVLGRQTEHVIASWILIYDARRLSLS